MTKEGKELYEKLENVFDILDNLSNNEDISGKVVIGTRSAYSAHVLPYYISEFNKIYPNIKLECFVGKTDDLSEGINNGKYDIIIDEYGRDGELESTLISTHKSSLISNKEIEDKIDIDYLKNKSIIIVSSNKFCRDFKQKYPNLNYIDVQSTPIMINMLENIENESFGISTKSLFHKDLKIGDIKEIETDFDMIDINTYVTIKKNNKSKAIREVYNFFKETDAVDKF